MLFNALIEEWPHEVGMFIHEMPGLYLGSASVQAALEALPDATERHLAWLASHGFTGFDDEPVEIAFAEQLPAIDGRYGPLFQLDRQPASAGDVERALQVARLARRDLIDLYRSVSAVRREMRPTPDDWSISEHLAHIAGAEVSYVDALLGPSGLKLPDDPLRALHASAAHAETAMRGLDGAARSQVVERRGEHWTVTKVLRRMTAHLREHYPWIQELAHS